MLSAYYKVFQQTFLAGLSCGDALPGAQAPPLGDSPIVEEKPHNLPPGALEGSISASPWEPEAEWGSVVLNFNPDGWVVKDVPQEGMIAFDFTAYRNHAKTNRSWVGPLPSAEQQLGYSLVRTGKLHANFCVLLNRLTVKLRGLE